MPQPHRFFILLLPALLLSLASCATTIAPTESTTETVGNTTNASTDFSSSTSPGVHPGFSAKAEQFVASNYTRIKGDMARGGGEYLVALAVLLEIAPEKRDRFFALTRNRFALLYPEPDTTPAVMLATLQSELAAAGV